MYTKNIEWFYTIKEAKKKIKNHIKKSWEELLLELKEKKKNNKKLYV